MSVPRLGSPSWPGVAGEGRGALAGRSREFGQQWLLREVQGRWRLWLFVLIALAATAFMLARLFVGGTVGLSDQGDGTRLLCSLGLREGNPYNSSTSNYLYPIWYDHQWYGEDCGAQGTGEPYNSTELWFAAAAKLLTHLLTATSGLDLRLLGVIFSVLVGVLLAGIALMVPGPVLVKLVVATALLLVIADGAFAGYFVSAYSEPAGFVGLLLLLLAVLIYVRTPRVHWWSLLLVGLTTMFTVAAKTQLASLLVSVIPLLLARPSWGMRRRPPAPRVPMQRNYAHDDALSYDQIYERESAPEPADAELDETEDDSPPPGPRLRRLLVSRWPALAVSAALLAGTVGYLGSQPQRFTVQNDYAAVFIEMLPHSLNPAQDLRKLGLPAAMLASSNYPINAAGSAAFRPDFYDFTSKAGLRDRLRIYSAEPARLVGMFGRGLAGMSVLRVNYVYSYPKSADRGPNRFECRVCVLQKTWTTVFANGSALFVFGLLAGLFVCGWTARTRSDRRARAVGAAGLFLGTSMIAQFWVVMLTEGASDLIKHLVFTNLMYALLLVFSGISGYLLRSTPHLRRQLKPRGTG